jgi:hypothetical protein
MKFKFKRTTAVTGAFALAAAGVLAMAGNAAADVQGSPITAANPGHLFFTTGGSQVTAGNGGNSSSTATWSTDEACPSSATTARLQWTTDDQGTIFATSNSVTLNITAAGGFTGDAIPLGGFPDSQGEPDSTTYQFLVTCYSGANDVSDLADSYLTYDATGNWTYSPTAPHGAPAAAFTVTSSVGSIAAAAGNSVNLTAAFTANEDATGTVQFEYSSDGTTWHNIGTPQTKAAGSDVTLNNVSVDPADADALPSGTLQLAARFVTGGANAATYTSSNDEALPATLIVLGGNSLVITGIVPSSQGHFIYTLPTANPAPATLSKAGGDNTHDDFTGTTDLGDVTVLDQRFQTPLGWTVTGQSSAFVNGTNTVHNGLGWVPTVVSGTTGATAGLAVTAPTPGLEAAAHTLGTAAVGSGLDTTVLDAALNFSFPYTTVPGTYTATLNFDSTPTNGS